MSADKTLGILDLYDSNTRVLTVSEIAEKLSQPQSSVYRHLRVLKERGYISESVEGQYRLGLKLLDMARIVRHDNSLLSVSRPEMIKLSNETKETIILSVRFNYSVVCLDTIQSTYPIKVSSQQGGIMPLHCGASSKVLLAAMEDSFVDELFEQGMVKKYSEKTIYEKEALLKGLQFIRDNGYAQSLGEIDEGVLAYGVPIHDFNEKVVASLSIAGPADRMMQQDKEFYIHKLKRSAEQIEQYL